VRGERLGDDQKHHGGQRKMLCLHLEQLEVTLMVLFLTFRCLERTFERLFLTLSSTEVDQKRLVGSVETTEGTKRALSGGDVHVGRNPSLLFRPDERREGLEMTL
jgi:hypothetical protein